jgi:glycosyltransferase involved in cell wall biosynthesis
MKALFCVDTFFAKGPDGEVYTLGVYPYSAWNRYFDAFDEICVAARECAFDTLDDIKKLQKSSGANIDFCLLPSIHAPHRLVLKALSVRQKLLNKLKECDALIIRGPSEYGMLIADDARHMGKKVIVEMSGCAWDHTWYHGSALGYIYAPVKYKRAQHMLKNSDFAMYVTRDFLQGRYPSNGHTSYASNVEIESVDDDVLKARLNKIQSQKEPLQIGLIGHIGNHLKGLGVTLEALGKSKESLPGFRLHVLGKGEGEHWNTLIEKYGLLGKIQFDGVLPAGEEVLNWLDKMDFYIQPSLHEGLPRSLIEAMSRGLPCLASDAGGIPELLDPMCIHHKGHSDEFAVHLCQFMGDKDWAEEQARQNFEIAKNYTRDILVPRRKEFWTKVGHALKEA